MSMIGLKATDKLIQKFYAARPKNAGPSLIDLNTFLVVASEQLLEAQDVTPELIELFDILCRDFIIIKKKERQIGKEHYQKRSIS